MTFDSSPKLRIIEKANALWAEPCNEIEMELANVLSKNINETIAERSMSVVIDLSQVEYVNSAAIGVIANLIKSYRKKKLGIHFVNPSPVVLDVLKLTNLDKIAKIYLTEDDLPNRLRVTK